jgi:hypothetical protein
MSWRDGQLTEATLTASVRGEARLRYGDRTKSVKLAAGRNARVTAASFA